MSTNSNNSFTGALSDEYRKSRNKIYHLTANLLLHCPAKIECSSMLLYSTSFNACVMQNHSGMCHLSKQITLQLNIAAYAEFVCSQNLEDTHALSLAHHWSIDASVTRC